MLTDILNEDGQLIGKRRPSTAVTDFASDVTGVEMNVTTGRKAVDMVIENFMSPESRSILLNPETKYTGISSCTNNFDWLVTIQNFASTVRLNEEGRKALEELKGGIIGKEITKTLAVDKSEKVKLQRLLIELMREEAEAMSAGDLSLHTAVNYKINATIVAIRLEDEKI